MVHTKSFNLFFSSNLNKISLRYVGKSAKAHLEVTPMLDEIIIGSILGDLSAERPTPTNNTRLQFKQSRINEPYIVHLYSLFSEYCGSKPINLSRFDNRPDRMKTYQAIKFQTLSLPSKALNLLVASVIPYYLFLIVPIFVFENLEYITDCNVLLSSSSLVWAGSPIITYHNAETDKSLILTDNKGKAGIYQWKHLESGKIYIGSAVDLSKRLNYYYSPLALKRANNYISRAIITHTHSAFSLTILEYVDILDKDKKEARVLILSKEQHYIDLFSPEYNINPIAGSRLGSLHSEETKAKISEANKGENHPMSGKTLSVETKTKISKANLGDNHPLFGKNHSEETKAKISVVRC